MPVYRKRDCKIGFEIHTVNIDSIYAEIEKEEDRDNLIDVIIRVKKYID